MGKRKKTKDNKAPKRGPSPGPRIPAIIYRLPEDKTKPCRQPILIPPNTFEILADTMLQTVPPHRNVLLSMCEYRIKDINPTYQETSEGPTHMIIFCMRLVVSDKFQPLGVVQIDKGIDQTDKLIQVWQTFIQDLSLLRLIVIGSISPPTATFQKVLSKLTKIPNMECHTGPITYSVWPYKEIVHLYDYHHLLHETQESFSEHNEICFMSFPFSENYSEPLQLWTATWTDILLVLTSQGINCYYTSENPNASPLAIFFPDFWKTYQQAKKDGVMDTESERSTTLLMELFCPFVLLLDVHKQFMCPYDLQTFYDNNERLRILLATAQFKKVTMLESDGISSDTSVISPKKFEEHLNGSHFDIFLEKATYDDYDLFLKTSLKRSIIIPQGRQQKELIELEVPYESEASRKLEEPYHLETSYELKASHKSEASEKVNSIFHDHDYCLETSSPKKATNSIIYKIVKDYFGDAIDEHKASLRINNAVTYDEKCSSHTISASADERKKTSETACNWKVKKSECVSQLCDRNATNSTKAFEPSGFNQQTNSQNMELKGHSTDVGQEDSHNKINTTDIPEDKIGNFLDQLSESWGMCEPSLEEIVTVPKTNKTLKMEQFKQLEQGAEKRSKKAESKENTTNKNIQCSTLSSHEIRIIIKTKTTESKKDSTNTPETKKTDSSILTNVQQDKTEEDLLNNHSPKLNGRNSGENKQNSMGTTIEVALAEKKADTVGSDINEQVDSDLIKIETVNGLEPSKTLVDQIKDRKMDAASLDHKTLDSSLLDHLTKSILNSAFQDFSNILGTYKEALNLSKYDNSEDLKQTLSTVEVNTESKHHDGKEISDSDSIDSLTELLNSIDIDSDSTKVPCKYTLPKTPKVCCLDNSCKESTISNSSGQLKESESNLIGTRGTYFASNSVKDTRNIRAMDTRTDTVTQELFHQMMQKKSLELTRPNFEYIDNNQTLNISRKTMENSSLKELLTNMRQEMPKALKIIISEKSTKNQTQQADRNVSPPLSNPDSLEEVQSNGSEMLRDFVANVALHENISKMFTPTKISSERLDKGVKELDPKEQDCAATLDITARENLESFSKSLNSTLDQDNMLKRMTCQSDGKISVETDANLQETENTRAFIKDNVLKVEKCFATMSDIDPSLKDNGIYVGAISEDDDTPDPMPDPVENIIAEENLKSFSNSLTSTLDQDNMPKKMIYRSDGKTSVETDANLQEAENTKAFIKDNVLKAEKPIATMSDIAINEDDAKRQEVSKQVMPCCSVASSSCRRHSPSCNVNNKSFLPYYTRFKKSFWDSTSRSLSDTSPKESGIAVEHASTNNVFIAAQSTTEPVPQLDKSNNSNGFTTYYKSLKDDFDNVPNEYTSEEPNYYVDYKEYKRSLEACDNENTKCDIIYKDKNLYERLYSRIPHDFETLRLTTDWLCTFKGYMKLKEILVNRKVRQFQASALTVEHIDFYVHIIKKGKNNMPSAYPGRKYGFLNQSGAFDILSIGKGVYVIKNDEQVNNMSL